MITISKDDPFAIVINPFTVQPKQQQQVVNLLIEINTLIKQYPGFVSATVHKSLDGTRVTNYAQWRSEQEVHAALRSPEMQPYLEQLAQLTKADWHLYEVVHSISE